MAFLRGGGATLRLLSDGRHGYTCPGRSHLTRHESGGAPEVVTGGSPDNGFPVLAAELYE